MRFVIPIIFLLLLGCPPAKQLPLPPPPPPPLDQPLPDGQARCGLVQRPSELIGGQGAYLETGKAWRCYNSKVRFGGATREGAVGLALYGGALLDADVMRDDEAQDGQDTLREIFPAPGFMGVDIQRVEVLRDGQDGGDAIIRVHGRPAPLGVLPQVVIIQQPYEGEVITDFIMHPDASYLEMTTTVYNLEARALPLTLADFLAFGSGVRAFTPETGFNEAPLFSSVSIYAGANDHVSYAYTVREGKFTVPFVDAGGTGALLGDALISDQESYTRFLAVGRGGLASALAVARELRGEPQGTLRVHLTHRGQPVSGIVTLYAAPRATDAPVANQIVVDSSGTAEARVLQGAYIYKAQAEGTAMVESEQPVTVMAGQQADITIALDDRASVTFHAHELDADGADKGPIPAKLSVVPLEAPAVDGDLRPRPANGLTTYAVASDGVLHAMVPPGRYRFVVSRGLEYDLFTHEATLASNDALDLAAPLHRVLPTEGLLAAEFHQHTLGSLDSNTDMLTKVLENAAEGVELAAATDHDNVKDYAPYVQQAGLTPFFQGWAGNEISYNGVGHFNAYPLDIDPSVPFRDVGARLWAGRSVVDLIAWLRARPDDPVVHVSHPRDSGGKGYFAQIKLNPVDGVAIGQTGSVLTMVPEGTLTSLADDFDALEVNDQIADPALLEPGQEGELARRADEDPTSIPAMVDWFHLLSVGKAVTALGNSDSHDFNSGSGWPRNYLVVDDDRPDAVTREDVRAAIRSQRVLVSNGLLVTPRIAGTMHLGRQDPVPAQGPVEIDVEITSAEWLGGASRMWAYANGRPLHLRVENGVATVDATAESTIPLAAACSSGVCRASIRVVLDPSAETWVVFAARGEGSTTPVGRGRVYGYTNPVYLDVDGGGIAP